MPRSSSPGFSFCHGVAVGARVAAVARRSGAHDNAALTRAGVESGAGTQEKAANERESGERARLRPCLLHNAARSTPRPCPPHTPTHPLATPTHHPHSHLQGLGYTDEDSAGQSNIFAVEPKQYVQGSARDTSTAAVPNFVYAVTAAIVGAAAIAAGVSLAPTGEAKGPAYDRSLASVPAYAAKFETSPAPSIN